MPELFGIDIKATLASAFAGKLRPGVLRAASTGTKPDPNNVNRAIKSPETIHNFEGFVETRTITDTGTLTRSGEQVITIIAGTITPDIMPKGGDCVVIDNVNYILGDLLSEDPAGAVYEFRSGGAA